MTFVEWLRIERPADSDISLLSGYLRTATDLDDTMSPHDLRLWLVDREAKADLFNGLNKASASWAKLA